MSRKSPRNNELYIHIGAKIKSRRRELKITQTVLGDAGKVTFQQVQKYEKGSNKIHLDRLLDFAIKLEVENIEYFLPDHKNLEELGTQYVRETVLPERI